MTSALPTPLMTPRDFAERVRFGLTTESTVLEFKRDLKGWRSAVQAERREGQVEFCRDICQFANSVGGCLLFGIDEMDLNGIRVASQVRGIDDFDGRRAWMEQAIVNFLNPSTFRVVIEPLQLSDGLVIAVNVAPSERLVTVWDRQFGTIECLRRSNHGKVRLTPDELESCLMDTSRRSMLTLRRITQGFNNPLVDLASGVWVYRQPRSGLPFYDQADVANVQLTKMNEHDFDLQIALETIGLRILRVPYGLVREAWLTIDQRVGLLLSTRVVIGQAGRLGLEPY